MSGWGSWLLGSSTPATPQPVEYPECPSPTTPAELQALVDKKFAELEEALKNNEGWNEIPVNEPGHPDIKLYDKSFGGGVDAVKVVGTLPCSVQASFFLRSIVDRLLLQLLYHFQGIVVPLKCFYLFIFSSHTLPHRCRHNPKVLFFFSPL